MAFFSVFRHAETVLTTQEGMLLSNLVEFSLKIQLSSDKYTEMSNNQDKEESVN